MTDFYPSFQTLMDQLASLYPPSLAESWDQVGLHFGHPNHRCKHIMTALDLNAEVVKEAVNKQVDTVIVHHPPIFTPIQRFNESEPKVRMYATLIKEQINVYAMHTNVDRAWNGMNDWLAEALQLTDIESLGGLMPEGEPKIGRIGNWTQGKTYLELIRCVKEIFDRSVLTIIGEDHRPTYQRVALVGGSGADFYEEAKRAGADVFITGDYKFHEAQEAYDGGLLTIDAGHYIEHIFAPKMQRIISKMSKDNKWACQVSVSHVSTNPFKYE